ncbi:MAG: hypothetical protein ACRD51_12925, partial [Candidatus Acidiferrum sp.]
DLARLVDLVPAAGLGVAEEQDPEGVVVPEAALALGGAAWGVPEEVRALVEQGLVVQVPAAELVLAGLEEVAKPRGNG